MSETEQPAPPFAFGQTVWMAYVSSWATVHEPCPVCFGKLRVTIILGNDEQVVVACEYCRAGMDGPTGRVRAYKASRRVEERTVSGMTHDHNGWTVTFASRGYPDSVSPTSDDRAVFADRAAAEEWADLHFADAETRNNKMFEEQYRRPGKAGWTVGYSRAQIARLKRELAWHEAKMTTAKAAPDAATLAALTKPIQAR